MINKMEDSYYYYGLGLESYKSGNIQEALISFLMSVTLSPHFKTYEQLHYVLGNLGYKEESEFMIQKAYELNSSNDKVSLLYAKCLIERGCKVKAKEILINLLDRNKTYLPARKILEELNKQ